MQSFFPILSVAIAYPMIGLNMEITRLIWFYAIIAVVTNCGAGMGFAVSAAVPSVTLALSIAPGLVMPQMLLAGIFIKASKRRCLSRFSAFSPRFRPVFRGFEAVSGRWRTWCSPSMA